MRRKGPQALTHDPVGGRRLRRRGWVALAVAPLAALLLVAAGCSSNPSQHDLAQALSGRYGLTDEQASCVSKGVFAHFSSGDLRKIRSASQIASLPSSLQRRLDAELRAVERSCGATSVGS